MPLPDIISLSVKKIKEKEKEKKEKTRREISVGFCRS
jgi:hypothetical protein